MYMDKGQVTELILDNGFRHARISCSEKLIPSPGQYLLAGSASEPDLLPVSLFSTESASESFIASAPIPVSWTPGTELTLRGPLGHGFAVPQSARKVALVAFDDQPARIQGLIHLALKQAAAVVLICNENISQLPNDVEVQPLSTLADIVQWADYVAVDVMRANLLELKQMLREQNQALVKNEAQILVRAEMPCGGVAECGVCALNLKSDWKMICKDGPVFNWSDI